VEFEKNGRRTCRIKVDTGNRNQDSALNDAKMAYLNGTVRTMYIEKSTYECFTESNVRKLAQTGLAFFIIMGVILLIWFGIELYTHTNDRTINFGTSGATKV
jgi:cell division protein FtsX